MHQKLLKQAGLLSVVLLTAGMMLTGCIDEPNPPVLDRITSDIRFVNAVPDAAGMDVYVDGDKIASGITYKSASNYLEVKAGNRFLRFVPAGSDTSKAVFRRQISVRSFTKITMAFFGAASEPMLLSTQERFTYADETSMLVDSCDVKLINVNTGGLTVKLAVKDTGSTQSDLTPLVSSSSLSSYHRALSEDNEYYLVNSTNQRVVTFEHHFKKPGYRYSIFLLGTMLQTDVLVLQDEPFQK